MTTRIGEFLPHFVKKVRLIFAIRVLLLFELEQSQSTSLPLLFKLLLGCFDLQFSGFRIAKEVQQKRYTFLLIFHPIFIIRIFASIVNTQIQLSLPFIHTLLAWNIIWFLKSFGFVFRLFCRFTFHPKKLAFIFLIYIFIRNSIKFDICNTDLIINDI